ncbi:MAG: hypothetical protein C5B44_04685 [Acidobacteria bacterium]|nr:MAG: hypothetical protein C5B44_04685 [Acidobacteriota bacterium]
MVVIKIAINEDSNWPKLRMKRENQVVSSFETGISDNLGQAISSYPGGPRITSKTTELRSDARKRA